MNNRKIIQIVPMAPGYVMALCNDGTCLIGSLGLVNSRCEIVEKEKWRIYDADVPQKNQSD